VKKLSPKTQSAVNQLRKMEKARLTLDIENKRLNQLVSVLSDEELFDYIQYAQMNSS